MYINVIIICHQFFNIFLSQFQCISNMTGWAPTRSRHSSDVASDRHKPTPSWQIPTSLAHLAQMSQGSSLWSWWNIHPRCWADGAKTITLRDGLPIGCPTAVWLWRNDRNVCCVYHDWTMYEVFCYDMLRCCCATVYMTTCNRKNPFWLSAVPDFRATFSFWMPAACVQFCGLARMTADARHGCWWQRCAISQAICHLCLLWPNHRHLVSLIDPLLDLFQA